MNVDSENGLLPGLDHIANFINSLAEGMTALEVRNTIYKECIKPTAFHWDLRVSSYNRLCEAAAQSEWIPNEYFESDWVSDCCEFLKTGKGVEDE